MAGTCNPSGHAGSDQAGDEAAGGERGGAARAGDLVTRELGPRSELEIRRGLEVELEHGARDPETNVTNDDPVLTGKIAWAHLKEFPDYYTRLDKLEAEADAYWASKRAT